MARSATARLFVALDLPAEVRAQLVGWARRCSSSLHAAAAEAGTGAGSAPGARVGGRRAAISAANAGRVRAGRERSGARGHLRLLEPETLHLTLCFLGSRPIGEIEALGDALALACATTPPLGELALGAPLWLPPRRPRALAVELHDDAEGSLEVLHEALVRELSEVCDFEHDTAGAAPAGGTARGAGRRFRPHVTVARMRPADAPRERVLPATPALAFAPRTLTLYRSWLTPSAAEYEGLVAHALAAE